MSRKIGARTSTTASVLGVAGILFGVSDVAIKALTGGRRPGGTRPRLALDSGACVIASVLAFYASARGLQKGEAVPVIAMTDRGEHLRDPGGILVSATDRHRPAGPRAPGRRLPAGGRGGGADPGAARASAGATA